MYMGINTYIVIILFSVIYPNNKSVTLLVYYINFEINLYDL